MPAPQGGSKPVVAEGRVQKDLIGTLKRPDGAMQVTYNGHPLYYYVKDRGAGKATGQDVYFDDERWAVRYLVVDTGCAAAGPRRFDPGGAHGRAGRACAELRAPEARGVETGSRSALTWTRSRAAPRSGNVMPSCHGSFSGRCGSAQGRFPDRARA
jgi:hypothetical protein